MNRYYLNLLGLRVILNTPIPLTISQRLQPFLCQPHQEAPDCSIRVEVCHTLPQPEGIWHGPECYLHTANQLQTFHCHNPYGDPFAMTSMDSRGNIYIAVLPAFADYFSGTSGIFNRIGLENLLLQYSGLLLHASLIKYAQKGIVFAGPSGVGKSTQAELWHKHFGADILNGDRAALRKTAAGWIAYGSPYAGTSGIYKNENAPLAAIIVLQQGKENRLRPMTLSQALPSIWPEISLRRWDETFVSRAMELCADLLKNVPVYLLECVPEESAAAVLKKGLCL